MSDLSIPVSHADFHAGGGVSSSPHSASWETASNQQINTAPEHIPAHKKTAAIVLAGGSGKRMNSSVKKQYMLLNNIPLLCHSLAAFEQCPKISEIVLVTSAGEESYFKKEIVDTYGFSKVTRIVCGGAERYHSVANGLFCLSDPDFVLIHDGARPFVTAEILDRIFSALADHPAVVVGMPVKDTIKVLDSYGFVVSTPNRDTLWQIQTPQSFQFSLIREAYQALLEYEKTNPVSITDDASVLEQFTRVPVKIIKGSYQNIKITTPEDLFLAEQIFHAD